MAKVVTGKVRFSYAHVWEPKALQEGQEPKYSVAVLIDKSDKSTLADIEAAIEAAKQEGASKYWGGKVPKKLKTPLRDGDFEKEDDENYENKMFLNASSKMRPGIVDEGAKYIEVVDRDEFYSGCYGRASINFYPFDRNGSKGVAAGLNNLQKLEDGDRLSGGASAQDDFGDDNGGIF